MPDNRYELKPYPDDGKTSAQKTKQIQDILITLSKGSESPAQRAGIGSLLYKMNPTLGADTARLIQGTIAQSPGMSEGEQGRLRDNILYNAFLQLQSENQQQLSK